MQPLNYSLLNKRGVVRICSVKDNKGKSCFLDENRHNKLCAADDVNDYVNAQIKKASQKLDDINT